MAGARYTTIAGSTKLDGRTLTPFDGQPLLHRFGAFLQILDERAGEEEARLFALPDTNVSRMTGGSVTTWYAAREGRVIPLSDLPTQEREALEARTNDMVKRLRAHEDAELRALASAALEHFSSDMIVAVGDDPVIIDWGLLPSGADLPVGVPVLSDASNGAHVEEASASQPDLSASEDASPVPGDVSEADVSPDDDPGEAADVEHASHRVPPAGGEVQDGPDAGMHAAGAATPKEVLVQPSHPNRWALGSLVVLTVLFAVGLVYVLWPGNLVFATARQGLIDDATLTEIERESIATLQLQIGRYRDALGSDLCTNMVDPALDGLVGLPFNAGEPPLAGGDLAPETPALPDTDAVTPEGTPAPNPGADPASAPSASMSSNVLLDRLDEIAVLVIARGAGSTSTGSGFLVAPDMVLTNYHVVEEMGQGELLVASTKLGKYIPASLVARTQTSDIGGADFALLKLAEASPFAPATLAPALERLDPVIAAGYPAFVVETDPSFIAGVQQGDLSQLDRVQMAVTQGVVMTAQRGINDIRVIAHSATISSGNSGGPLADMCGRVVGINTFARSDGENALRNNYALSATDAVAFLRANGVEPIRDPGLCNYAPAQAASGAVVPNADTTVPSDAAASPPPDAEPAATPDAPLPDPVATPEPAEPEADGALSGEPVPEAEDPAESPDVLTVP